MRFNIPKDTDKISWTKHSIEKMRFYNLSPQRVLRVLRKPDRCQEAVAPGCIACMQSLKNKAKSEIWMMYQNEIRNPKSEIRKNHKKIITAWRYPTVSPVKDKIPIPEDILEEVNKIIK